MTNDISKYIILIICIIIVFITNIIAYYKGIKRGMVYSIDRTYDVFMKAIYIKFKKENKSDKEAKDFMTDVHNLLDIADNSIE